MNGSFKREFIFFLLVWIIFFSCGFLCSQAEKKGLELIRSGEALFKKTDYEKAMARFAEARLYIYTDTNRLRLYKNISGVYYALGKEKEAEVYIMKVLDINLKARLRGEIAPGYRILFLDLQQRLKKLIADVRALADRKLFAEAKQKLEKSAEFKNHPNNKWAQELRNYIKAAEKK